MNYTRCAVLSLVILLLTFSFSTGYVSPLNAADNTVPGAIDSLPLMFFPYQGEGDEDIQFEARGLEGQLYFTPSDIMMTLSSGDNTYQQLVMHFQGANLQAEIEVSEQLESYINIFEGADHSEWRTRIPTYAMLSYRDLYPGIETFFEGTGSSFKGTFFVAPYADPSLIQWQYQGATQLNINPANGDVNIGLPDGSILVERAPIAWQEIDGTNIPVEVNFNVNNGVLGFKVGAYNSAYTLTIDPILEYSTYIGGSNRDVVLGVEVDDAGFVYLTGLTDSPNFPTTSGAYIQQIQSERDAFVMKINPNAVGNASLVWATYLGGQHPDGTQPSNHGGDDIGFGIALDNSGQIYITGTTLSIDFPTTASAYQVPNLEPSGSSAFLTKLNSAGNALLYSTYLGGSSSDVGFAVAADEFGNAYVGGMSQSLGQHGSIAFPTTPNAYSQATTGVQEKIFISKFDTNLSGSASLIYSTFLGGTLPGQPAMGMDADQAGNVYITGMTRDVAFPVTANAYQSTIHISPGSGNPSEDAFVSQIDTTLSGTPSLIYSTYLGGSEPENWVQFPGDEFYPTTVNPDISVSDGLIYVTGGTMSLDFPIVNGFQTQKGGYSSSSVYAPLYDAFVARLNPQKTGTATLEYASFLGGTQFDFGTGISATGQGNVYITGSTAAANFPLRDAIQTRVFGDVSAFATKIDTNQVGDESLIYSTYIGRNSISYGGIAVDGIGTAYIGGAVKDSSFPIVSGFQSVYGGNTDGFLVKLAFRADLQITKTLEPDPAVVGLPMAINIEVKNKGPETATAIFLTEVLPEDVLDFVDVTTTQGQCEYLTSVLRCDLGYLEDQQIAVITINIIPTDPTVFNESFAGLSNVQTRVTAQDLPSALASVAGVEQDLNQQDNIAEKLVSIYTFDTFVPTLLEPITSTTNTRPTFRWQAVPGAVSYEFQLNWNDLDTTPIIPVNGTSFQPPNPLLTTTYQWRVRGVSATNTRTDWSVTAMPTISALTSAAPKRNLVTTPTLTLTWNHVTIATSYELEIASDLAFQHKIYQTVINSSNTLTYTLPTPSVNGLYYWRIRFLKSDGNDSSWSTPESFSVER